MSHYGNYHRNHLIINVSRSINPQHNATVEYNMKAETDVRITESLTLSAQRVRPYSIFAVISIRLINSVANTSTLPRILRVGDVASVRPLALPRPRGGRRVTIIECGFQEACRSAATSERFLN